MTARDANDIARERGVDGLRAAWDAGPTAPPRAGKEAAIKKRQITILSSADFVKGLNPPDYLIDGIMQRGYFYGLTGKTGDCKTALALLISACVALGRAIGDCEVTKGRVLFFAGENPDDIRGRWLAMSDKLAFDVQAIEVHFVAGHFKFSEYADEVRRQVEKNGDFALVVVDTNAAFFEGNEENSNTELLKHAQALRDLTKLRGNPTVLVNCHPVKNATLDNLIPRGGGSFLAELDGNLVCWMVEDVVHLHWQGKFRGPDFSPLAFRRMDVTSDLLRNAKGRLIPTVYVRPISAEEQADLEKGARRDEDVLLMTMLAHNGASAPALADAAGWRLKSGKPYKSRVVRLAKQLTKDKLVKSERGTLKLTEAGITEAKKVQANIALAGSTY